MSQRDLLRTRRLPRESVVLAADSVAYGAALREVAAAMQEAGGAPTDEQRQRIDAANAAFEELQFLTLEVKCLPPAEWEALIALHPSTDSAMQWDTATFKPAVCAACVVPPDDEKPYTVDEWNELVRQYGALSAGEEDLLFVTAVQLNTRAIQVSSGKGFSRTLS